MGSLSPRALGSAHTERYGRRTEESSRVRCVTRRATCALASGVPIRIGGPPCTLSQVGYPQFTRRHEKGELKALPSRARRVSALYAVALAFGISCGKDS